MQKKIFYSLLVFILTLACLGSIYFVINDYKARASKVAVVTLPSPTSVPEPIDQPPTPNAEVPIEDPYIAAPKEVTPETSKSEDIIKGHNQVNDAGVDAEKALDNDGKKTAYLTFDDGPSLTVTPKILTILKNYSINATFFLIGQSIDKEPRLDPIVKRLYSEGNAIGNHSYTHNIKKLYPNNKVDTNYFISELDKTEVTLTSILGTNFGTSLIRMPGGFVTRKFYHDPNIDEFLTKLKEKNYHNIDWNASDSDSEGTLKTSLQLFSLVKSTVGNQNKVVILMHDTYGKEETAKALPNIIQYLKAKGYEFKTLK